MRKVGVIAHDGVFELVSLDIDDDQVGAFRYRQPSDVPDLQHACQSHQRLTHSLHSPRPLYHQARAAFVLFNEAVEVALAAA